eukprot:jgi/Psemu1/21821/gm1.21821_g
MERATPAMNAVLRLREGFKRVRNCASSATAAASSSRSSWYFCGNDTTLAESESTTTEYNFFRPPTTSTRSFDSTNHHHRRHLAFCNAASSLCTYDGGDEGGENDNDNDNDSLATKTTYSSFVALGRESSSSSTTKPDLSQSKAELPIVMMGYLDDPATVATTDGVDDNDDDAMYGKYHYDTYGEETATRTRTAMATATMTTLMTSDNNGKTQTQPQTQTETDNDSYSYHSNEYNLENFGLNIVGLVTDVVTSRASWSSHSSSDGDTYSTNNHNDNHTSIKNTTTTTTTTTNNNNHTKTKNTDTDSNTNKSPDPDGRWHADFGLAAIETESRDGTLFKQRQHDKDNTGMEPPGAVSSSSGGGGGCDSDTMTRELPSFGKSREFRSFGSNGTNNNNGGGGSSSNSNNSNSSGDSCSFKPTFITPDEDQQLEQEHTRYSYLTRTTSSSSSRSVATYDSATLCDGDFRLVSLSSLTSSSSAVHQQQQKQQQKQKQQQQQQQQAGADTISGHDPTVAKDNNGVGQGQPKQQRSRTSKRPTVHAFSSFFTKKTISSSSQLLGGGSYKPIAA